MESGSVGHAGMISLDLLVNDGHCLYQKSRPNPPEVTVDFQNVVQEMLGTVVLCWVAKSPIINLSNFNRTQIKNLR